MSILQRNYVNTCSPGGYVTSAGWQVTLCDPIWHVSSRSGDGRLACKLLYLLYFTYTLPLMR